MRRNRSREAPLNEFDQLTIAARHRPIAWQDAGKVGGRIQTAAFNQNKDHGAIRSFSYRPQHIGQSFQLHIYDNHLITGIKRADYFLC